MKAYFNKMLGLTSGSDWSDMFTEAVIHNSSSKSQGVLYSMKKLQYVS